MKLPFLVALELDLNQFSEIIPAFPNWQRSFVSGSNSPLFRVQHFIHAVRKNLVLTRVHFLKQAEGPPGNVHGGATAGLIDEVMGIAVWHQGKPCVTQKLELHYGKLLPLDQEAFVYTDIVSDQAKTLVVHSTVYGSAILHASKPDELSPHVSGQGIFHRLSPEQLARFK